MINKLTKFYIRCAPGHTDICHLEIYNILKTLKGSGTVNKERDLGNKNSKNGLYVTTNDFKHGTELAMKSLTIQDIECVILDEVCKSKRDVKRRMKKIVFDDFIPPHSFSNIDDFNNTFKMYARANKSIVNSSRFLKEEFCNALVASGVLQETVSLTTDDIHIPPTVSGTPPLLNTIRLSLIENRLTVGISLAGEMDLYKRTYKDLSGTATAPLPEHHASACILWTLHTIQQKVNHSSIKNKLCINNIIIPFAGTGTLGFESLLVLLDGSAGSGLFKERKFAFDSFPCSYIQTSDDKSNTVKLSTILRQQMKDEVTSKLLNICQERNYNDMNVPIPHLNKGAKILYSDINEVALSSCEDNITSFIQSSDNVFPSTLFMEPKLIDFLRDDVASVLNHTSSDGGLDSGQVLATKCDMSTYNTGTTFILLNPPFGLRLAKKSSTISMYNQIARQLIGIREIIQQTRQESSEHQDQQEELTVGPLLMGLCLCPDVQTWSTFITTLTATGGGFGCETTHFSLGGNDMRVVCFWAE